MEKLNLSIIKSLDGHDENLLPHIPFLLQDLWEIGSSPEIINQLLIKNNCIKKQSKVLDLGCGKGAISVNIAKQFGCYVLGIDAMPEFIEEASFWADKYHQSHLCTYEVDDIRGCIKDLNNFDIIILGSIGPIFGNIETTLKSVASALVNNGYVILDDGYIPDNSDFENENYLKKNEVLKQIKNAGFQIIESLVIGNDFMVESDTEIYKCIEKRAQELIKKYPNKSYLFEEYLRIQRQENDVLENKVECVTWLLRKSG